MENLSNSMSWQGMNPLTLRIVGSGEYVAKECARLVTTWNDAIQDREEEFRQEAENNHADLLNKEE